MNLTISKSDAKWARDTLTILVPHDPATERVVRKIDKGLSKSK